MLYATVKERLIQAMRANDSNAKNVIRVLLGRLQTTGQETDEVVISSVKMLIKQNEEEIQTRSGNVKMSDGTIREVVVTGQEDNIKRLQAEIVILKEFLPAFLSPERIKEILTSPENQLQINGAKNVGAATGVAMKLLKSIGAVEGSVVKEVVGAIYYDQFELS